MPSLTWTEKDMGKRTREFYINTLRTLERSNIPFLLGGAYALFHYTRIERYTKDLDVFIMEEDFARASEAFSACACKVELPFPHWLGKAVCGDDFVDLIFSSGNGVAKVDAFWFKHAADGRVFDMPVKICPAEEVIWSKGYIMERERYDGADVAHLIQALGPKLDWTRLLLRFDPHWQVLLSHLVLFSFIYPAERDRVPAWVLDALVERLKTEGRMTSAESRLCQGTLLSREQYLADIRDRGYEDARLEPRGNMSPDETRIWTDAIGEK